MFLENVSRDILEPFKIYNAVEANGHSGKRTALLTAAFTKPRFPQLTYELCIFPLISRKRPAPVKDTLFTNNIYYNICSKSLKGSSRELTLFTFEYFKNTNGLHDRTHTQEKTKE